MEKEYSAFLIEIKEQILQSRFKAAAAVNRELILLYFQIGSRLSKKIQDAKWGSKVVRQLANDLQKEINGLRGFSYSNMKNMRQFADEYPFLVALNDHNSIGQLPTGQLDSISQSLTGQLQNADNEIVQLATAQFKLNRTKLFQSSIYP